MRYTESMEEKYEIIADLLLKNTPLFEALADPMRQTILLLLADKRQLSVGELTGYTDLSRPAISHHIRVLRDAGLLRESRVGIRRYYQPSFGQGLESMNELMQKICNVKEIM